MDINRVSFFYKYKFFRVFIHTIHLWQTKWFEKHFWLENIGISFFFFRCKVEGGTSAFIRIQIGFYLLKMIWGGLVESRCQIFQFTRSLKLCWKHQILKNSERVTIFPLLRWGKQLYGINIDIIRTLVRSNSWP